MVNFQRALTDQLNASAAGWVRDYNANAITHVDCRITRDDGNAHVRDDLWNLIAHHPQALREMPSRDVCAYFMRGKEETRKITNNHFTFVHPLSKKSESYNLEAWAKEFANGDTVRVSPMLLGECSVRVEFDRFGQEPLRVEVQAVRGFDDYGRPLSATLIGEERRQAPHGAATESSKLLAQAAYGEGTSLEQAEANRSKNARPFQHMNDGKGVVAHTHLGKTDLPQRLIPAAQDVQTPEVLTLKSQVQKVQVMLTVPEAVRSIKDRLGDSAPTDIYSQIKAAFPGGHVPQDWADHWGETPAATGTHGGTHGGTATGLRRVK